MDAGWEGVDSRPVAVAICHDFGHGEVVRDEAESEAEAD